MRYYKTGRMPAGFSWISLTLCFSMIFTLLSAIAPISAHADSRLAVITDMGGTVTVQAAGGYTSYDAYVDMGLNEGDYIETGYDSYVVIKISDTGDELTFGSYSEAYISELAEENSGKKSKFKMWAGSLWSSIKRMVSDEDELEVETPTAVMGVQGTQFLTHVDPYTGETSMLVASGKVRAATLTTDSNTGTRSTRQESRYVTIYPTQQIQLDSRNEVQDLRLKVSMMDPSDVIKKASPKVLETFIKHKAEIDEENAELLDKLKKGLEEGAVQQPEDSTLNIQSLDELSKVTKNLDNLVGNVAKTAADNGVFNPDEMNRIMQEANEKIGEPNRKLDLQKVEPLDPTAGTDPELEKKKQEELKKLQEQKEQQQQEESKRQAELQAQLDDVLKQVKEQQNQLETQNQAAAKEISTHAEEVYVEALTPEEAAVFEENKAHNQSGGPTPPPVNNGTGSGGNGSTGGNTGGGEVPNAAPTVSITHPTAATVTVNEPVSIDVTAQDSDGIAKVEFSINGTKVYEDVTAPYSYSWTPLSPGAYQLSAKAYDTKGASKEAAHTVTAEASTQLPDVSVTLTAPPEQAVEGQAITLNAAASSTQGIQKVEFWANGALINGSAADTTAPYSYNWTPAAGIYEVKAVATDNKGNTAVSAASAVKVVPQIAMVLSPHSNDSSLTDLTVQMASFHARGIQLHFTTEGGQRLVYTAQPSSKIFTGSDAYLSDLNEYSNGGTPPGYEYVFAGLFTKVPDLITETEVFRITLSKADVNVTLAYVRLVLLDGTVLEFTPNQIINLGSSS